MGAPMDPRLKAEREALKLENFRAQANWAMRETRRLKDKAKMYQDKTAQLRQSSQTVRGETASKEAEIRKLEGGLRYDLKLGSQDSASNEREISKLISTITGVEPVSASISTSKPRPNQARLDALKKRRVEAVTKYNALVDKVCAMADSSVLELALQYIQDKVETHKSQEELKAVQTDNARMQKRIEVMRSEIERMQAYTEVNCTMADQSTIEDCTMATVVDGETHGEAQGESLQSLPQSVPPVPSGLGKVPSWSPRAVEVWSISPEREVSHLQLRASPQQSFLRLSASVRPFGGLGVP